MENTILSDKFSNFKNESVKDFPVWINTQAKEVPEIFKKYAYPINSWPVIINKDVAAMLEKLCVQLPKLLHQIPKLYFNNDQKKIADYYFSGNAMVSQFAMICHEKNIESGCRLDLTLSKKGFQVLEINVGSSIGGWQVQSFESIIRKLHPELSNQETRRNYHSENSQKYYIKFLVDKVLQHVKIQGDEVNIFVKMGNIEDKQVEAINLAFFDEMLKKEFSKRGLRGEAFTGKLKDLKLNQGKIYLENTNIHGIIILNLEGEEIPLDVFRSFILDNVYLPDHIASGMYGDKRNLGLLRELAEQGKFSTEDNQLILQSIPWTANITDREVLYNQEKISMLNLLRTKKDELVIKAAQGFQGKDVFIGKFSSSTEWEEAIETAIKNGHFIAQEFSDSLDFFAPNKQHDWTPHKLIWGAFGFGETYGGVWVRMSEVATDVGVINSATGAVEAIVYECVS
ncbi:hypothetical protein IMCC3317_07360 [Kordia antarctica]|uniref:Glutathionylspermidine synthase pre-ATP-grasp-like domain-containing protein n=1 Tax=Kordia antarctica TaxID=1218801 RepID=A0A7L4ZFX5_9FLAO|nr:hypothetical protein [Kordia antarctica]QHI35390.1 hypothetical protein IMCC3317_07360 [Kordia antarctica]